MTSCPKCGKEFGSQRGMKVHYGQVHEGSLKTKTIECDRCGEKEERRKTVIEDNEEVFCSTKCKYDTKTSLNCEECGEKFEVYKKKAENRKHCSTECRNTSYRNGDTFECEECGEETYRPNSQIQKWDKKYCSPECQKKHMKGENHPLYKENVHQNTYTGEWTAARNKRLEKDNHECQKCGTKENLHIHHIHKYRLFEDKKEANKQRNLITLCASCHMKHEKGSMEINYSERFVDLTLKEVKTWVEQKADKQDLQSILNKIENKQPSF